MFFKISKMELRNQMWNIPVVSVGKWRHFVLIINSTKFWLQVRPCFKTKSKLKWSHLGAEDVVRVVEHLLGCTRPWVQSPKERKPDRMGRKEHQWEGQSRPRLPTEFKVNLRQGTPSDSPDTTLRTRPTPSKLLSNLPRNAPNEE